MISRRFPYVKRLLVAGLLTALPMGAAFADSCERSRELLLGGIAGELPQQPASYKQLFNVCLAAANLSNVKDSFLLKDGGIGVIPKRDELSATAATLSEFCQRYPRATLRFATRSELQHLKSLSQLVQLSSGGATSCRKIMGLSNG